MVELIDKDLELVVKFVDAWRFFKVDPIKVTHRVAEKIGSDNSPALIVLIGFIIDYKNERKETKQGRSLAK